MSAVDFCPASKGAATLALQLEGLKMGILGCYSPNEPSQDTFEKELYCKQLASVNQDLPGNCDSLVTFT